MAMPHDIDIPRKMVKNIDAVLLSKVPKGTYVHAHDQ